MSDVIRDAQWDALYFQLVVTLAKSGRKAPSGNAHMAAEYADAAVRERARLKAKEEPQA
jgi:hypothetical protein